MVHRLAFAYIIESFTVIMQDVDNNIKLPSEGLRPIIDPIWRPGLQADNIQNKFTLPNVKEV